MLDCVGGVPSNLPHGQHSLDENQQHHASKSQVPWFTGVSGAGPRMDPGCTVFLEFVFVVLLCERGETYATQSKPGRCSLSP